MNLFFIKYMSRERDYIKNYYYKIILLLLEIFINSNFNCKILYSISNCLVLSSSIFLLISNCLVLCSSILIVLSKLSSLISLSISLLILNDKLSIFLIISFKLLSSISKNSMKKIKQSLIF